MKEQPRIHVASGAFKGRRLNYPPGRHLRPTMQRTREAVFDSLGAALPEGGFADLYAAGGAVGIEALSRGASVAHFVERDPGALACLEENLRMLGLGSDRARVHRGDVESFVAAAGLADPSLRIVFADPPYDDDAHSLLALLDETAYPHLDRLVVEHRGGLRAGFLRRWVQEKTRRYGATRVTFFEPAQGGEP